jgi:phosphoglycerate dehydrogenase-like enzyme
MLFMGTDEKAIEKCFPPSFLKYGKFVRKGQLLDYPDLSADCEYLFATWGMEPFTEAEIDRCLPSLKALFYAAGTVKGFAKPFLAKGVRIFSGWAANAIPVAEFAVAQIVLANKGFFSIATAYRTEGFASSCALADRYPGNYRTKVGLLGMGMVGRHVVRLLKSYDLEPWVFDPFLDEKTAMAMGVRKADLAAIFRECRVVSNHLASNAETEGMLGYQLFSSMQPHSTFINTARGRTVDEGGLMRALSEDTTLFALLDVTDPVEPRNMDDPLLRTPNVLVTPHRAGAFMKEIGRLGSFMIDSYHDFVAGRPARWEITEEAVDRLA